MDVNLYIRRADESRWEVAVAAEGEETHYLGYVERVDVPFGRTRYTAHTAIVAPPSAKVYETFNGAVAYLIAQREGYEVERTLHHAGMVSGLKRLARQTFDDPTEMP